MLLATIILLIIYLWVNHSENKRREINRKYNPIGAFDKAQKIYDDAFYKAIDEGRSLTAEEQKELNKQWHEVYSQELAYREAIWAKIPDNKK